MIWGRKRGHHIQTPWETVGGESARAVATLDGKSTWSIHRGPSFYFVHLVTEGKIVQTFCVRVETLSAAMLFADEHVLPDTPPRTTPPPQEDRVDLMWGGLYVDYM